ncbi:unnamed protein product, partial [Choristocarpus tenellus]
PSTFHSYYALDGVDDDGSDIDLLGDKAVRVPRALSGLFWQGLRKSICGSDVGVLPPLTSFRPTTHEPVYVLTGFSCLKFDTVTPSRGCDSTSTATNCHNLAPELRSTYNLSRG